jgi:hypothetical protein
MVDYFKVENHFSIIQYSTPIFLDSEVHVTQMYFFKCASSHNHCRIVWEINLIQKLQKIHKTKVSTY